MGRRGARGPRTRGEAWRPRRRRAGSPPSAPGPRTPRTSAGGADARTAPPRAPPPGSGSGPRPPPRSRFLSAVDLVEQLLGRRDRGPAPKRVGDELRGLGRAVAELLDEHLPHELAQTVGVGGGGRGRDRLPGDAPPREGGLPEPCLALRGDGLRPLFVHAPP